MRRRQSDDRPVVTQEAPETPEPDAGENNGDSDNSDSNDNNDNSDNTGETPAPGTPGAATAIPGMPYQQTPGMPPGRVPGMYRPGMYPGQPGFNPAMPNQNYGTQGGMPGTMPNQMPGMGATGGFSNNTGQSGDQGSSGSVYVAPALGQTPTPSAGSLSTYPGQPTLPGQPGFPVQPGFAGQQGFTPGRPGMLPNQFQNQSGGFVGQQPFSGPLTGGSQTQPTAGSAPGPGNNFGLTGPSAMQPPGMGGTQIGGGIAGVASEYTGPTIKIYNERKKYNEWEFVYDQAKDRGLAGVQGNGGAPGTAASQMGNMPGQQPGLNQPGIGGNNGFGAPGGPTGSTNSGNSSIFTPSPGFGQPTPQQPQPQQQQP